MLVESNTAPNPSDSLSGPTAETDWKEIKNLLAQGHGLGPKPPRSQLTAWRGARSLLLQERLQRFYSDYPTHPLRWNAVVAMEQNTPTFILKFGPDFDQGKPAELIDVAGKAAFAATLANYKAAMATAQDLPEDVLTLIDSLALNQELALLAKTATPDWAGLHSRLTEFARKHPAAEVGQLVSMYMRTAEKLRPTEVKSDWTSFINFPHEKIALLATKKVRAIELLAHPLDLSFTAVDGRKIDLAQLRGKVVLVDFWATWCPPCRAELPNLKAVYAELHDRGFEIIGISFDDAEVAPTDTAESGAAKLQTSKEEFIAFLAKEEMPWAQQFDGSGWKNPIGAKYAINSLPTMFLLDQSGRFVTSQARGESLRPAIVQLLENHPRDSAASDETPTFCVPGGPCT